MPIHVIVGASKNIGYTLAKHLDADKSNTVFGIARSIEAAQKQAAADGLRVTFFQGDLTNYDSLVAVAKTIGEKTGGVVDQLWNNGAYMSELTIDRFLSDFDQNEHQVLIDDLNKNWQTNVLGVINSTNAFLPLVRKSSIKKVATISTGLSDTQLARDYGIWENAPYAISKAALNMVVAKYDAKFRPEGVLFLAVCPGVVDNGREGEYHALLRASAILTDTFIRLWDL